MVLDLILTTNEYLINNITVTDEESVSLKSDHKAITADINIIRKFKKPEKRSVYDYGKGDFNSLRVALRSLPLLDIVEMSLMSIPLGQNGKMLSFPLLITSSRRLSLSLPISLPTLPRKLFTI